MSHNATTGLILTGGGARAAYQVGVLAEIAKILVEASGIQPPIRLVLSVVPQPAPSMRQHSLVVPIILANPSPIFSASGRTLKQRRCIGLIPWVSFVVVRGGSRYGHLAGYSINGASLHLTPCSTILRSKIC